MAFPQRPAALIGAAPLIPLIGTGGRARPQDPDPAGQRWEEGARTPHPQCLHRGVVPAVPAAPLPCGACLGGYAVVFIAPSQPLQLRWQLFKVVIEKRGSCSAPRSRSNGSGSVPAASGQSPRGEPACDPACDPPCVPACNKSGRNVPGCRARGGVPAAPGAGGAAVPDPEVLAASRPSPARLDPRDPQSAPGDTGSHHGAQAPTVAHRLTGSSSLQHCRCEGGSRRSVAPLCAERLADAKNTWDWCCQEERGPSAVLRALVALPFTWGPPNHLGS